MSQYEPERAQPAPPTYLPNVSMPPPPPGKERDLIQYHVNFTPAPIVAYGDLVNEIAKKLQQKQNEQQPKCIYCGSRCTDSRGNCGACGAPLEDEVAIDLSGIVISYSNMAFDPDKINIAKKCAERHGVDVSIEGMRRLAKEYQAKDSAMDRASFLLSTFGRHGMEMGNYLAQCGDGVKCHLY